MFSSSPGVVIANTNSVGASLIVWLIAGLLGWTGASSFAELGTAIPLNGGPQVSLSTSKTLNLANLINVQGLSCLCLRATCFLSVCMDGNNSS